VPVAPADISVQALTGTTESGLASQASADLDAAGYTIGTSPGNADLNDATSTVIRYDPEWNTSLKTLKAAFPDATVEKVRGLGGTFQLVVGSEYVKPQSVRVAEKDIKLDSHTAADDICG
jgi:hypothetical protein